MFESSKNKSADKEITTNPEILFELETDIHEIMLHGIRLNDSALNIPKEDISTTTFEKNPEGATQFISKDNKIYYYVDKDLREYILEDRITAVLNFDGILHLKSGAKYVIKNGLVVGIGIHQNLMIPYRKILKKDIQKKFGTADSIKEEYEEIDGTLFYTEFYFSKRKIKIVYDDWERRIEIINIGQFYNRQ